MRRHQRFLLILLLLALASSTCALNLAAREHLLAQTILAALIAAEVGLAAAWLVFGRTSFPMRLTLAVACIGALAWPSATCLSMPPPRCRPFLIVLALYLTLGCALARAAGWRRAENSRSADDRRGLRLQDLLLFTTAVALALGLGRATQWRWLADPTLHVAGAALAGGVLIGMAVGFHFERAGPWGLLSLTAFCGGILAVPAEPWPMLAIFAGCCSACTTVVLRWVGVEIVWRRSASAIGGRLESNLWTLGSCWRHTPR